MNQVKLQLRDVFPHRLSIAEQRVDILTLLMKLIASIILSTSVVSPLPSFCRQRDPTFLGTSSHYLPIEETSTYSRRAVDEKRRLIAAKQRVQQRPNVAIKEEFLKKRPMQFNLKVSNPVNSIVLGMTTLAQPLAYTRSPSPSNKWIMIDSITKMMQNRSSSEQLKSSRSIRRHLTGQHISGKPVENLSVQHLLIRCRLMSWSPKKKTGTQYGRLAIAMLIVRLLTQVKLLRLRGKVPARLGLHQNL